MVQQQVMLVEPEKVVEPQDGRHPIEITFNSSTVDILDAIQMGKRAQVDVKGKLAELYLKRILETLKAEGKIDSFAHQDKDSEPDFLVTRNGKTSRVECKNLRDGESGKFKNKNKILAYKVEVQRTRNSKDGTPTRLYRKDYIEVLAVCMFNQTGKWEYCFIKATDMEERKGNPGYLEIMQRVPLSPTKPWTKDISEVI